MLMKRPQKRDVNQETTKQFANANIHQEGLIKFQ